jgi:hypothetical protein
VREKERARATLANTYTVKYNRKREKIVKYNRKREKRECARERSLQDIRVIRERERAHTPERGSYAYRKKGEKEKERKERERERN